MQVGRENIQSSDGNTNYSTMNEIWVTQHNTEEENIETAIEMTVMTEA